MGAKNPTIYEPKDCKVCLKIIPTHRKNGEEKHLSQYNAQIVCGKDCANELKSRKQTGINTRTNPYKFNIYATQQHQLNIVDQWARGF